MHRNVALLILGALAPVTATAQRSVMTPRDSAWHVLNRLAYGPTPGLVDQVTREGVLPWIDRQLGVSSTDDPALPDLKSQFGILAISSDDLLANYVRLQRERRADRRNAADDSTRSPEERRRRATPEQREMRSYAGDLQQLVVYRAARSSYQLAEVMADFWSNHFNIFFAKNLDRVYLPEYIEQTIRPRALGRFEDLLVATAKSPAMMVYLDNAVSVAPGSRPPQLDRLERLGRMNGRRRPPNMPSREQMEQIKQRMPTGLNENYARELMELHTLGVDGGYTQKDVTEVARILTGWSVERPMQGGNVVFNDWAHDRGPKTVLGVVFPAGQGQGEGDRLLNMLAENPSTAHYVSGKLCARFVNDAAPDGCVDDAVRAWKRTSGDIREVLRAIFHSPDFWATANVSAKVKTPLEFVTSAVRALGGTPDSTPRLAQAVARLGQPIYLHTAPNGYPERQDDWVNSGALLNRMNLAVALAANRLPGVSVDLDAVLPVSGDRSALVDQVNAVILGGKMTQQTRKVILDQIADLADPRTQRARAVGLAIGGPEFQRQ